MMDIVKYEDSKDFIESIPTGQASNAVIIRQINEAVVEVIDANGWWKADVKWDGCINFSSYSNIPYWEDEDRKDKACCDDSLHICEGGFEMIEILKQLQMIGKREFNKPHQFWAEKELR